MVRTGVRNIDDNLFNTPLRQTTERLMRKEPESLISVAEAITSRNWNAPITECCEEPLNPSAINQFALASRHIMGETVMPISASRGTINMRINVPLIFPS
uniref:Uncharacterized protein n=1 Tax=Coccidioides posadasii RMSCC 3488 TaxID=454284 RepID=A0A0J6FSD1_COCPO|nr:hypothetical protein CPAG_08269 [Coccidioides posadasii RMSCC 3488]